MNYLLLNCIVTIPCLSLVHPQPLGLLPGRLASAGDLNERTTASGSLETSDSLV